MRTKTFARTVVLALVLVMLLAPGVSSASPIPGYFDGENPGLLCLAADIPGFGFFPILLQINFDPNTNSVVNGIGNQTPVNVPGIPLSQADQMFFDAYDGIGLIGGFLGGIAGLFPLCAYNPSALVNQYGFTGLSLAELLSAEFEHLGFPFFIIIDVYRWLAPGFLPADEVTRFDIFQVFGFNDLEYMGSAEFPDVSILDSF